MPGRIIGEPTPATDGLPAPAVWGLGVQTGADVGLPLLVVKRAAGERLLTGAHKLDLAVELRPIKAATANVVGVIRAGAPKSGAEPVVIGAHLDHLGMGGPDSGSLEPARAIHNGADDNASGVAALLEVGRRLQAARARLTRDVYLVAFSAEEMKRPDALYTWVVDVAHNPTRLPNGGSCIFLHVWSGADSTTVGCTAMAEPKLAQLIADRASGRHCRCHRTRCEILFHWHARLASNCSPRDLFAGLDG